MDQLDIPQGDEDEVQADFFVPDINSSDPEERKLARRIRIQKRQEVAAKQKKAADHVVEEKPREKPTILQNQLEKSSEILKQLFQEAEIQVTNVRVANDVREFDRRELEEENRKKIQLQLKEDAQLSTEMFEDISRKWIEILKYNDPLHIHDDLLAQKEKCDELVAQKDSVIAMLKQEISLAETKFYRDQQVQNEDISMLAKRVEQQVIIMRAAHSAELQAIEDVMILERENMTENNSKRWDDMYKRREQQELSISENKIQQKEEFDDVVAKVRTMHYEKIRKVKITLEKHCATLTEEFEYVKACAVTNSEKMDYNYQILKKREGENIIIKSNQKRMINKLQDAVNDLKRKGHEYETKTSEAISKQYNEIINLKACIESVKKKSRSLSISNDRRFEDLWELNTSNATEILRKVLTINRLLHEQQLGLEYEEPHLKLLKKAKLPSYVSAINLLKKKDTVSDKSRVTPMDEEDFISEYEMESGYRRILKIVLEKIANKSGFLVEAKVKKILGNAADEEGVLVHVDNVFEALGMTTKDDINLLLRFFKPYIKCPICSNRQSSNEVGSETEEHATLSFMSIKSHDADAVNQAKTLMMETEEELQVRSSIVTVDNVVAAIVDEKRLSEQESVTEYDASQKIAGECLGPSKREMEFEKKVIQVTDYGEIIGENTSLLCFQNHPLVMNPSSILRALREFLAGVVCPSLDEEKSKDSDLSKIIPTISRLLDPIDVEDFWGRYKAILAENTIELWDALFYGLQKYHLLLEERHRLNRKLDCLRKQNLELKHLLSDFRVKDDMKPPCAVERQMPQAILNPKFHQFCDGRELARDERIVKRPMKK